MHRSTYDIKSTPELRKGDIVLCHGMRVLVDGELRPTSRAGGFYTEGLVLNEAEVKAAKLVPISWLHNDSRGLYREEPRWTIQGNELARWAVAKRPIGISHNHPVCGMPGASA